MQQCRLMKKAIDHTEQSIQALQGCDLDFYAFKTRPHHALKAQAFLARRGIAGILPIEQVRARSTRYNSRKTKQRPNANGYIFIGFKRGRERFYEVLIDGGRHFAGLLTINQKAYALSNNQLQQFITNTHTLQADKLAEELVKGHQFTQGDKAHVLDGVLKGFMVEVLSASKRRANVKLVDSGLQLSVDVSLLAAE